MQTVLVKIRGTPEAGKHRCEGLSHRAAVLLSSGLSRGFCRFSITVCILHSLSYLHFPRRKEQG